MNFTIGSNVQPVRINFANFFEPDENGKYGCAILIPKANVDDYNKIMGAIEQAKVDPVNLAQWGGQIPFNMRPPLQDGDTEKDLSKYPEFAGNWYLNVSSLFAPQVVNVHLQAIGKADIKSGDWCVLALHTYAYTPRQAGQGLSVGLDAVLKIRDGEALGGTGGVELSKTFGQFAQQAPAGQFGYGNIPQAPQTPAYQPQAPQAPQTPAYQPQTPDYQPQTPDYQLQTPDYQLQKPAYQPGDPNINPSTGRPWGQ